MESDRTGLINVGSIVRTIGTRTFTRKQPMALTFVPEPKASKAVGIHE